MTTPESGSIGISAGGDLSGQVAVGSHNTQVQQTGATALGAEDLAELRRQLGLLERQVRAQAGPGAEEDAAQQVRDLEGALTSGPADVSRLRSIGSWIVDHVPEAFGAVVAFVVHPLVGKLVDGAAEAIIGELRDRYEKRRPD